MPDLPNRFRCVHCVHCDRAGTPDDVATGWSMSSRPRPAGSTRHADHRVSALCPDCARRVLRDLEGKLDP